MSKVEKERKVLTLQDESVVRLQRLVESLFKFDETIQVGDIVQLKKDVYLYW